MHKYGIASEEQTPFRGKSVRNVINLGNLGK